MAISATFWTFAKRKNSTLKPGAAGADFNISIKYPCTVENPSIEIHAGEVWAYNYCYIPFWGRYYFIDSHTSIAAGTYELRLSVDTAATYKDQIAPQTVFAEYSTALYNQSLVDPRNQMTDSFINYQLSSEIKIGPDNHYIYDYCRIIPESGGNFNGTDVIMGAGCLRALMTMLSTPSSLSQLMRDINNANPFQNICEVWQTPIEMSTCAVGSESGQRQVLGAPVAGRILTDATPIRHVTVFMLGDAVTHKTYDYRDRGMKATLQIPFVGSIDLDRTLILNSKSLEIEYVADVLSGSISFVVYAILNDAESPREFVGSYGANLKKNIAMYSQQSEMAQFTKGAMNFVAGIVNGSSGGVMGAGIGAAAALYENFVSDCQPPETAQTGSYAGTFSPFYIPTFRKFILNIKRQAFSHAPGWIAAKAGRPAQTEIVISQCGGFIKARSASVAIPGTAAETETLNNILNGGMYYE